MSKFVGVFNQNGIEENYDWYVENFNIVFAATLTLYIDPPDHEEGSGSITVSGSADRWTWDIEDPVSVAGIASGTASVFSDETFVYVYTGDYWLENTVWWFRGSLNETNATIDGFLYWGVQGADQYIYYIRFSGSLTLNQIVAPGEYNALDATAPDFVPPDVLALKPSVSNSGEFTSNPITFSSGPDDAPFFSDELFRAYEHVPIDYVKNLVTGTVDYVVKEYAKTALALLFPEAAIAITAWDLYKIARPLINVYVDRYAYDMGLGTHNPTSAEISQAHYLATSEAIVFISKKFGILGDGASILIKAGIKTLGSFAFRETDSFTYSVFLESPPGYGVTIIGGDKRDLLVGSLLDDHLSAGAGADTLMGMEGADTLEGGDGSDKLNGGAGKDKFLGTLTELDGDIIEDYEAGEIILVRGTAFVASDVSIVGDTLRVFANHGIEADAAIGIPGLETLLAGGARLIVSPTGKDETALSFAPSQAAIAAVADTSIVEIEGNGGPISYNFTVTLDRALSTEQTVGWSVIGYGSHPVDAADFTGGTYPFGILTFAAGETSKTIAISPIGDVAAEADESFSVVLLGSSPQLSIGRFSAIGVSLDDDSPTATVSVSSPTPSQPEGSAGATPYAFNVTLSQSLQTSQTVAWAVIGTGVNPANASDFAEGALPSGILTFVPQDTGKVVTVLVNGDLAVESEERFAVVLADPSSGLALGTASASGTIQNDDNAIVSVVATDLAKPEGNTGTTSFHFVVNLSQPIPTTQSVNWTVVGDDAHPTATSDFAGSVSPFGAVTLSGGEMSKVVTIQVSGDTTLETDEEFKVILSAPTAGLTIGIGTAIATIVNDDVSSSTVSIEATDATKTEGNSGTTLFTFKLTRSGDTSTVQGVSYTVSSAGTNPATATDFAGSVFPSGAVIFAAGESSKSFTVSVQGDTVVEPDEGFAVILSLPTPGLTIGTASAGGTILNNDASVSLANPPILQAEGNGGTTAFTFTIVLSGDSSVAHSVAWTVTGSGPNPAGGSDFADGALPAGTVTFAVGETSKTVTVNVATDKVAEPNEGFTVTLTVPSPGLTISNTTSSGAILNDDLTLYAGYSIRVGGEFLVNTATYASQHDSAVAGLTDGGFVVTWSDISGTGELAFLDSGVRAQIYDKSGIKVGAELHVNSTISGSQAQSATIGLANGGFVICWLDDSVQGSNTSDIKMQVYNASGVKVGGETRVNTTTLDNLYHPDIARLPNGGFVITWDDFKGDFSTVGIKAQVFDSAATKVGSELSVNSVAAGALEGSVVAGLTTGNFVIAWASNSGTSNIKAQIFNASGAKIGSEFLASTATQGMRAEPTISGLANGGFVVSWLDSSGQGGDTSSAGIKAQIFDSLGVRVGNEFLVNTEILDRQLSPKVIGLANGDFVITWYDDSGQGSDKSLSAVKAQQFDSLGTKIGAEFLVNTITSSAQDFPAIAGLANGGYVISWDDGSYQPGTGNSGDNSADGVKAQVFNVVPVTASIAATIASLPEGNVGTTASFDVTVTLDQALGSSQRLNWSVTGSGSNPSNASDFVDGVLPTGTLVFAPGETSKTITMKIRGDSAAEADEGFAVVLSSVSSDMTIAAATATVTGTILNDDNTMASITAQSASRPEGQSGTTTFTFAVLLDQAAAVTQTVNWSVEGNGADAANAADFEGGALPSGTLTFTAGETSKMITVNAVGDTMVEADEGFKVTLSSPSSGLILAAAAAAASGTIVNDDSLVSIASTDVARAEGNSATTVYTFTLTQSGDTSVSRGVSYAVSGYGANAAAAADFVGGVLPSGAVIFAVGETSKTITVNVQGDTAVEADESFVVTLSGSTSGLTMGTSTATGVIQNDDASVSLATLSATKSEGNSGSTAFTFTATLTGDTAVSRSVSYLVSGSGANPVNAADFAGGILPSGTVIFAVGETSKTITVNVQGDIAAELSETFLVTLSSPTSGLTVGTGMATGTIQNDDVSSTTVSISPVDVTKAEGNSGTTVFTFTLTQSGDTSVSRGVSYAVAGSGINAANAADFFGGVLPSGTVIFAVGETSKTITVNVQGDSAVEPDETFVVTLSNPTSGLTVGIGIATGTIQSDDTLSTTVSISAADATKAEGNSGATIFTFTLTRSGDTSVSHGVSYIVSGSGNNAASAADFSGGVLPSGAVIFVAGETSKTITVSVQGDTAVEVTETFAVTLASPTSGITIGTGSATGEIQNDDTLNTTVSISTADATKSEGNSGSTVYTFTLTRSGDTSVSHGVSYGVSGSGNNAASAADFSGGVLPSGAVIFSAGEASKTITVSVQGDTTAESTETFAVTLSSPTSGLTIGIGTAIGTIQNDDVAGAVTAHDDAYVVLRGQSLTATASVLSNDIGGATTTPLSGPAHGTLQLAGNGTFTYAADAGFFGIDSFTYRASNGGSTDDAQVHVHVVPVNTGAATTLSLLTLTAEEQIASTYTAFFGRGADMGGFGFWVGEFVRLLPTQGASALFANIASSFGISEEAKALYPFLANPFGASDGQISAFLNSVYNNLFNRSSDAGGLAYWTDQVKQTLQAGQFVGSILVNIMGGAQDTAAGKDITTLMGKVSVSLAYVREQETFHTLWTPGDDRAEAVALLAAVTAAPQSVLVGVAQAHNLAAADLN